MRPSWPPSRTSARRASWSAERLAPYKERGTDVNVVLDLMIHDIDLVQSLAGSEIVSIDAIGTPGFLRRDRHRQRAHPFREWLRGQHHGEPRQPEN